MFVFLAQLTTCQQFPHQWKESNCSLLPNKRPWTFIVFREDFQGGRSMVDAY